MNQDSELKIVHTMGVNNCGGRCVIHAHVRNGRIERITTDTAEAAGDGVPLAACVRGMNYHKTFLSEERLQYPLLRTGKRGEGQFKRISWEEAVERIASEWIRIRDTYGPASRYVHNSSGVRAVLRPDRFLKRLLALDGGYLNFYHSYSTACTAQATKLVYGSTASGSSLETLMYSKLILLWGHNPVETKFDCVTMYWLRKAREAGIPIISIDPRQSDTTLALGAEWIPIRPATDAALQDAMAYVLVEEDLYDREFLDRCCLGFDKEHMPEGADPGDCVLSYLTGEQDGI
ncbi:MAG: molybdopterin-dependent oxidoreductase, partial [Mogibacterium sp.]|nr:molybdopterin-dependent oxidoreductase [Mogibacterium sp.]